MEEKIRYTNDPQYPIEIFLIMNGSPYWHKMHWSEVEKIKQMNKVAPTE